jgi:hypothetical protein
MAFAGYTAYGFNDDKFKYGFFWQMLDKEKPTYYFWRTDAILNKLTSLTTTNDVLGRVLPRQQYFRPVITAN